jgi:KUP system potassium uptake protein
VLHERTVFLTVATEEIPHVPAEERIRAEDLGNGFWRVIIRYGFLEDPDVPAAFKLLKVDGLEFRPMETTFFLGRETLIATKRPGMAIWRERLFARMARNERPATSFFRLPPNRVVELGEQIEL